MIDLWTSPRRLPDGRYRPILHVRIFDGITGELLADVDAASTADGLAYYLRSRRIDEAATEASVGWAATDCDGKVPAAAERIIRQERAYSPVDPRGQLVASLYAEVGP